FKILEFTQTGNNAPVPATENPANASAFYNPATNQTVTAVTVSGPSGTIPLTNIFGNTYIAFQQFTTAAAMDTFLPKRTYTISAAGAGSGSITVPNAGEVPVPKILNLVELGTMDPTKEFILKFAPFTGATANDSIMIEITAAGGRHFYAPDYCIPRSLTNT